MDSNLNGRKKISDTDHGKISPALPRISLSERTGQTFCGETQLRKKQLEEEAKLENNKCINLGWIQTYMIEIILNLIQSTFPQNFHTLSRCSDYRLKHRINHVFYSYRLFYCRRLCMNSELFLAILLELEGCLSLLA